MTNLSPLRVAIVSTLLTAGLAAAGTAWTWIHFGVSPEATAARLERHVQQSVGAQSLAVEALARHVAAETTLIAGASASHDQLPRLFDRLRALATPVNDRAVAVTVYVPAASATGYRVLAWSDGPGEQKLTADRLAGPSALFVAPGHVGLRLIAVEPVAIGDKPVAVAVVEAVLAPVDRGLTTPYGPVTIIEHYASARDEIAPHGFPVLSPRGAPLIEVRFDPALLAAHRLAYARILLAIALLPLLLGLAIAAGLLLDRTPRNTVGRARWRVAIGRSATAIAVAGGLAALGSLAGVPESVRGLVGSTALLVLVVLLPAAVWWQMRSHPVSRPAAMRATLEHLAGGVLCAGMIEAVARLLERWVSLAVLDRGLFVLFPLSIPHTISVGNILLLETAAAWLAASLLAALAIRWRVLPLRRHTALAIALWLLPTSALLFVRQSLAGQAGPTIVAIMATAVVFALSATTLRRVYRHGTQSTRLLLALLAALAPLVALYPLAAITADRATRRVIETVYAPATAGHPQELLEQLRNAQQQVDEMAGTLAQLVSAMPPIDGQIDSQAAFLAWSATSLAQSRVISDVELYGPDRTLVSRFAFNLPEYVYRTNLQPWQGSTCSWEVFGEVPPFGTEERRMLHAERGVCDAEGLMLGGVVVHVASDDYQALPFVSFPSPYYDALGASDAGPRVPDLTMAVYGWSSQPFFTSGRATWPVAPTTFDRLYREGGPFWTTIASNGVTYDVHSSQNRAGIYALGYPRVTMIEHATRLAEIVALVVVFFVFWQVAALLHATLTRRPQAPLRRLFQEVRTSFYRKLFISFVIVAVVPVLAAAVAFGSYMTAQFKADVEFEATSTVTVAKQVFKELTAAGARTVEPQATQYDDVMVWIRQVIDQDVNLFDGSELIATSQRDLFESGFLPERTPAEVYRGIALERRPVIVAEDRLGAFEYLVAAAPVSAWGREDAVITVPLAPRQREMERELDTLNRRVLVGAILVVLFAAIFGASLASRISDPVARLTRATRQIAAGRLDVRVATDTADELRRLVDDFNSMAETLGAQRAELARANQLKAWNEMARQVAHEIKNPLTPVQLAAEHLKHVHDDRGRPLGAVLDRCVATILAQVRLLRQIASEFANFSGDPTPRPAAIDLAALVGAIVDPYRVGLGGRIGFDAVFAADFPPVWGDRTLLSRALTNLVENAVQAMPDGGTLRIEGRADGDRVVLELVDTGVGMDALALEHAFEPYFSTKTGGSGLGLANARRNIEREGGTVTIASAPGAGTTVTVRLRRPAAARGTPEDGPRPSR